MNSNQRKIDEMRFYHMEKEEQGKTYKIVTGKEATSSHNLFEINMGNRTRWHGCKLYENRLES